MRVLVTGATGFVGTALVDRLHGSEYFHVRVALRRGESAMPPDVETISVGDLGANTEWGSALAGVHTVVHLAARVHIMSDNVHDPLVEFRRTNVAGTLNLATQAAANGVRRFIFLSSIKVHGECTSLGKPFTVVDAPAPMDPYGISKYEAEIGLRRLVGTDMEIVVIRPPLVYGPRVKGNFLRLLSWIYRGVPLPFANVDNRRSFVGIHNLTALIERCITHPAASGQTFLVADDSDISTGDLVRRLAAVMGKRPCLFAVPLSLTRSVLKRVGRQELSQRVFGSLQVDAKMTRDILEWEPPFTMTAGLEEVGRWYLQSKVHSDCVR